MPDQVLNVRHKTPLPQGPPVCLMFAHISTDLAVALTIDKRGMDKIKWLAKCLRLFGGSRNSCVRKVTSWVSGPPS